MKKLALLILLMGFSLHTDAQEYTNGIGFRGGLFNGITFKHFTNDNMALEGILSSRWRGFQITGLVEYHNDITDVNNLKWFYGYGGHIGFYDGEYYPYGEEATYTNIGVDGIIGLEYVIPNAPISLGLDWKPYFNFVGYTGFIGDAGAISIRFLF
jgi:hypothetical protein